MLPRDHPWEGLIGFQPELLVARFLFPRQGEAPGVLSKPPAENAKLNEHRQLEWSESFLDGSFARAKKGARKSEKNKRGKETKWMVAVDGRRLPLGNSLHFASPPEVRPARGTDARGDPRRLLSPRRAAAAETAASDYRQRL